MEEAKWPRQSHLCDYGLSFQTLIDNPISEAKPCWRSLCLFHDPDP